jgi:glutamyl/glutaminyl-tRNA synthetase
MRAWSFFLTFPPLPLFPSPPLSPSSPALGVKGDLITHTSDYFDVLAQYARDMLGAGNAYMDDTPQERMRDERGAKVESARRGEGVAANLARFEAMLSGSEEGKAWCMRAKIDMGSDNGTLRDPVMYRCNADPHHRTGTRFKAYPTYDFACPIVDTLEGVTHALRTSEYADRAAQYAWIQATLGLRKVHIHEFSRLNFVYTLLSKRKLTWFVEKGHVEGWHDPRFPTVQGVLRRGVVVPALREFILSQGASKRVLDMEWDKFWSINKKHIDVEAKRFTALAGGSVGGGGGGELTLPRVLVVLTGGEGLPATPELRPVGLHPKNAACGSKAVWFGSRVWLEGEDAASLAEGEEVTFMKWGNVIVKKVRALFTHTRARVHAHTHTHTNFCSHLPPTPPSHYFPPYHTHTHTRTPAVGEGCQWGGGVHRG